MLNVHLADLNRVISQSTNKYRPFFQALKKNGAYFHCSEECETSFKRLKRYLSSPPMLSKPFSGEIVYLYLVVSESAVSGALVHEDKASKSWCYVSHAMNEPQTRYQRLEKLVLALFIISRKLKYYFQTVPIIVLTEHLWRSIVKNSEAIGRISKWASVPRSYTLSYKPRTTIKGQVFVAP